MKLVRNLPDDITPSRTEPSAAELVAYAETCKEKIASLWCFEYAGVKLFLMTPAGTSEKVGAIPLAEGVVSAERLCTVKAPSEPITRESKPRKVVRLHLPD